MANTSIVRERLKNVMLKDTSQSMDTILRVLKSDIFCLLSEYMIVAPEDLKVDFEVAYEGTITIFIKAKSNQILDAGFCVD